MKYRYMLLVSIVLAFLLINPLFCSCEAFSNKSQSRKVNVTIFWAEGCPHCAKAKPFLEELARKYQWIDLHEYEVYHNKTNYDLWVKTMNRLNSKVFGVPTIVVNNKVFVGFSEAQGKLDYSPQYKAYIGYKNVIEEEIIKAHDSSSQEINETQDENKVFAPIIGEIDVSKYSLLILTIIIAFLDGFNPCAMWVLTFLLSLLIYTRSRKKMALIGFVFVITSAIIYFLFMAAWLNVFLLVGYVNILRVIVGIIAVIAGIINIKEFFFFKKGISLTIPDSAKPKLIKRMRSLIKTSKLPATIFGTIILAVTANAVEGLCTAGFPAIYTRILTLRNLPKITYYSYLALYNLIYVIPYATIVLIFTITLGGKRLTEKQGKALKLISGILMFVLGLLLLFKPEALMLG